MTRTRSLRLAAAALTATAALTLTACGGGDGSGTKTTGKADTSGADQGATQDGQEQGGKAGGDSQTTDSDGRPVDPSKPTAAPAPPKKGKDGKVPCTSATVKVAAKAVSSPVNHLLLVATNTSKASCDAYGFPFLRFDADQATVGTVEESHPQAVTTIAPGKSAYAAVLTSSADGSGGNVRQAKKLAVFFQGADGGDSAGGRIAVALPGGTVSIDDSARVTYWQGDSAAALKW
jgi:Protein of unknown function (DUF4232)